MGLAIRPAIDLPSVAQALKLSVAQVTAVATLFDDGNTVPFITRYRKDQTGGLDEQQVREIESRLTRLRLLAERKQTILRSIESQGKLTPELAAEIENAEGGKQLEDLYLPFKPKKQTLATTARERGLEPLCEEILAADPACQSLDARAADFVNSDRGVPSPADALLGVGHILAELFSERADLRRRLRKIVNRSGRLVSAKGEGDEKQAQGFRDYFQFSEQLERLPPHRVLAINRGEKAKLLRVKVEVDLEAMHQAADDLLTPPDHPHAEFLRGCARDALARLVIPSLEREVRRELTDWAETHAVHVFARNLRNLLLQPPVHNRRVLAVDPGFKSGCKLAALDEFGNLLDRAVVHIVGKPERREQAKKRMVEFVKQHQLTLIAIGNGTACRETEELVTELIAGELSEQGVAYVIVNEAGASVYSTSPLGREELPEFDATLRSAISIGRRIQDPLSELVKIDPANIGVGLYQHDVKAKHLRTSLDAVVESCVNFVGVDLNTASPALLRYVSGLNQLTARRLYDYRRQNGPFRNREQLKDVPGFGEATFVQAAGFLKINGDNPLDATWIHPESYSLAGQVLERVGEAPEGLRDKEGVTRIADRAATLDVEPLAEQLGAGTLLLKDIVAQLTRPGRDPREDLPPPIFKKGVLKLDDLAPGMELMGAVLNVVDFGAFVDIGLHDTGLVHISQLANKYVRDPHEVVSVGDIVKVWVHEIDKTRRRVSLSMIPPGSERGPHERGQQRGPRRDAAATGQGTAAGHGTSAGQGTATGQGAGAGQGNGPGRGDGRGRAGQDRPARPRRGKPRQGASPSGANNAAGGQGAPAGGQGAPAGGQGAPASGQGVPAGGNVADGGGRMAGGNRSGGRNFNKRPQGAPARPAKPLAPLTSAMKAGKEPLRTFGDLKQFIDLKKEPAPPPSEPSGEAS